MLTQYNVAAFKTRVRAEFGLEDTEDVNNRILLKLNEAQQWIIRRRPNWSWITCIEHVIDIQDSESGVGSVENGSTTLTVISGPSISKRDVIVFSEQDSEGTEGYLVCSVSGSTITLSSQYRGSDNSEITFYVQKQYFQLPDDFIALESTADIDAIDSETLTFKHSQEFNRLRHTQQLGIGLDRIYTVVKDPLKENGYWYFAVYPFFNTQTTIKISYYREPPALMSEGDEPIIPRIYRTVLLYFTYWFMAVSIGHENFKEYRDMAISELRIMMDEDDASDEVAYPREEVPTWDLSALRDFEFPGIQDYTPRIV